jgi:hypothetical protein
MSKDILEVYIVYLIAIDEENYVEHESKAWTVHKTWDGAEKELEKQIDSLVSKYKGQYLQGYENENTEDIINEFCYIKTLELED